MIKASILGKDPFLLMGLTEGNIIRLKNGQPIKADFRSFGLDRPGSIGVIYGVDESHIEGQLREAGVISDETKMTRDPQAMQEASIKAEYDKILVATVGLPRSGKTTWAQSQAWPIVNPDSVRLAIHGERFIGRAEPFVWATVKAMVRSLFLAGHKIVILDACNISQKRRDEWQSKSGEWTTFFKIIDTEKDFCLMRANKEGDTEIMPVIERMAENWEPLADDEMRWPAPVDESSPSVLK